MSGITEETGWNQRRYDIRTIQRRMSGTDVLVLREKYRKNTFILVTNVL